MSSTAAPPQSFEVLAEQWKDECRTYAKRATAQFDYDPVPVILLACEETTKCIIVPPEAMNLWQAKDIIFYDALPYIVEQEQPRALGFFSANWYTETPAHIRGDDVAYERYSDELDAFRDRHGSIQHHRDTKEGIGLTVCDGVSFGTFVAETRRHKHKPPTFGPWKGDVHSIEKQLSCRGNGGRIAQGMAIALGVDFELDEGD